MTGAEETAAAIGELTAAARSGDADAFQQRRAEFLERFGVVNR